MSLRDLVLVRLGVAINLVIGQVVAALLLPVFLDTLGTMLVAVLAGPVPAVAAGLTSQVLAAVVSGNFTWLPFAVVQLVIAFYTYAVARLGVFRRWWTALAAGALLGAIAGLTAAPIAYRLFGGVTSGGVSVITTVLRVLGVPLPVAVAVSSVGTDVLDKTITAGLVFLILSHLPRRLATRFPRLAR